MRRRAAAAAGAAAILAVAFAIDWIAGRRGFFAFDQSIPFDAGWRVVSGQVPFRDFILPVGPVLPWLQGLGFALFGVGFRGYLLTACLLNVAATGLAMLLVACLFPARWGLWAAAGLLTALWFQPPAGTPWFEPVAYLAALPGVAAWVLHLTGNDAKNGSDGRGRVLTGALAGAGLAVAFLAKQSVALFLAPAALLLLAVELRFHAVRAATVRAGALAAGGAMVAVTFGTWLATVAEPGLFVRHALEIPGSLAPARALRHPGALAIVPWTGAGPLPPRVVLFALGAVAAVTLARNLIVPSPARHRIAVAAALTVGLLACQNLLAVVSRNQPELGYGLLGVVAALGLGVAWETVGRAFPGLARSRRWRAFGGAFAVAALALLAARGAEVAFGRTVHEGVVGAPRFVPLPGEKLEPLLWAEPTRLGKAAVTKADVETLLTDVAERPGELFVFPDWTVLYGLLGRSSPQPLLWFHSGLTYPAEGDPGLERRIVRSLELAEVETVVVERVSWLGTRARLADLPTLAAYLERYYAPERTIGPFEIRTRRPTRRTLRAVPGPPHAGGSSSASADLDRPEDVDATVRFRTPRSGGGRSASALETPNSLRNHRLSGGTVRVAPLRRGRQRDGSGARPGVSATSRGPTGRDGALGGGRSGGGLRAPTGVAAAFGGGLAPQDRRGGPGAGGGDDRGVWLGGSGVREGALEPGGGAGGAHPQAAR